MYANMFFALRNKSPLPSSSSGLGRRPFKAEIMGSNPIEGAKNRFS